MKIIDIHTHTYPASHDAKNTMEQMALTAVAKNLAFLGFSNHFDYDICMEQVQKIYPNWLPNGDENQYFCDARKLQEALKDKLTLLVGAEFGFSCNSQVCQRYLEAYNKLKPNYVINSVHGVDNQDYACIQLPNDAEQVFSKYLQTVRQSLDAPYHYDIVGHFEYVLRYVSFEQKTISIQQFGNQIDDILQSIIAKGKILEVNSSTKTLPRLTLPSSEILTRYYQLGGRKVSFGSDAHDTNRIADKYQQVVTMLKQIGFDCLTVPFDGNHIEIEI